MIVRPYKGGSMAWKTFLLSDLLKRTGVGISSVSSNTKISKAFDWNHK